MNSLSLSLPLSLSLVPHYLKRVASLYLVDENRSRLDGMWQEMLYMELDMKDTYLMDIENDKCVPFC